MNEEYSKGMTDIEEAEIKEEKKRIQDEKDSFLKGRENAEKKDRQNYSDSVLEKLKAKHGDDKVTISKKHEKAMNKYDEKVKKRKKREDDGLIKTFTDSMNKSKAFVKKWLNPEDPLQMKSLITASKRVATRHEEQTMKPNSKRVANRHIEKSAGAAGFDVKMDISDPRKAFEAAKRSAEWERGRGGYSGTIAEKDSFRILSRTPMAMADAAEFVRNKQDNDKWGPAYAIPYGEERELSRKEYTVKIQARNEREARMKAKEIIKAKGRTRKGATVVVEAPYKKTTLIREAGKAKTGWVPDPDQYWIVSEYDNLRSMRSERYGSKKEALAVAKEMLGSMSGAEVGMNKAVYEIKKLGKVKVTAPSTRLAVFEVTGTRIQLAVSSRPQGWWFWGMASY